MKTRFDTLLRTARLKEEALQRDLAKAQAHLQDQEERLAFIRRLADDKTHQLQETLKRPTLAGSLQLYQNFFSGVKKEETLQQSILAETARRLEEARADLIEAARKRRTFEILRDSELLTRKKARRKRETALLDKAAANLWLRGRGQ